MNRQRVVRQLRFERRDERGECRQFAPYRGAEALHHNANSLRATRSIGVSIKRDSSHSFSYRTLLVFAPEERIDAPKRAADFTQTQR
jgi:hypothetical protein